MRSFWLASFNAKKQAEFQSLARNAPFKIRPLSEAKQTLSVPEEPFETFMENALTKARTLANILGAPTLADDSGLMVPALGAKMPGVHSARYAGVGASDQDNRIKLIESLQGLQDRRAFFVCVLVLFDPDQPALPLVAQGVVKGTITLDDRGDENSFGYDPIFLPEGEKLTFLEMSLWQKSTTSHRARAFSALQEAYYHHSK